MSGSPQHWPLHSGAKATATQGTWANLNHFTSWIFISIPQSRLTQQGWRTPGSQRSCESEKRTKIQGSGWTQTPRVHQFHQCHQFHQFHLHWQQRSRSREPLCAHRKPDFTSLPCFPAKINTISFKFISPGGLIPQRSLSTKYYYYPNRLSWVIFLFEKKCLEPNMSEGLEVTSKPAEK